MGLLTNEKQRNKLVNLLISHDLKLSVVLYISGLIWFLALAYQPLNAGTYFSENALLPGLVESDLPGTLRQASRLKDEVKTEINKDQKATPQKWIYEKFNALGLDTYSQNFSLTYPFKSITNKVVYGENVYAILRARRASSTEALVLSVPLRPVAAKQKPATAGGIALALALAEEFKLKPYWAKNIVFLFTEYDEVGTQAFLDAYHETSSEYIRGAPLEGRSGSIQAAINLELPLERVTYFDLSLEGLNGQLPNLDLVNLVVKLCRKERGQVTIHQVMAPKPLSFYDNNGESFDDYKLALKTMLKMMWYQASGAPSGNHGLFHRFHIEALTLRGVKEKKATRVHDLSSTARVVEGIFRSLNNLQERFHQSFFFYILPSIDRYVSIGMYMPPFGLMAAAGLIKGISLWVGADTSNHSELDSSSKDKEGKDDVDKDTDEDKDEKKEDEKQEDLSEDFSSMIPKPEDEKDDETEKNVSESTKEVPESTKEFPETTKEVNAEEMVDEEEDEFDLPSKGILTVIPVVLICLLLGWLACQGPEMLTRIMPKFRIHVEDMIIYSLLAIFGAALMYPKLMIRKSSPPNRFLVDWQLLKSIALISQSVTLVSISVMNISQAFFLTAFMVPVTTLVKPTSSRFLRWFQMFALILVSPFTLMILAGLISVWPQPDVLSLFLKGFAATKELIFLGVMDTYLFNAWTHSVITTVIFPIWLFFWAIPWVEP